MDRQTTIDQLEQLLPLAVQWAAEQERRIQHALSRLSPEHRAVLVMKDMEGQKYETMAEILGVPIGTVMSRLSRAREAMRSRLAPDPPKLSAGRPAGRNVT